MAMSFDMQRFALTFDNREQLLEQLEWIHHDGFISSIDATIERSQLHGDAIMMLSIKKEYGDGRWSRSDFTIPTSELGYFR